MLDVSSSLWIELPWIDKKLHSHNSGAWRSKADAVKLARELAAVFALKAARDAGWKTAEVASVFYGFRIPDKRKRDVANIIQSCKPYIDGCVDAKVIAGDDWARLSLAGASVALARDNPGVSLVFSRSLEGVATLQQINSACLSYRHDFGLLAAAEKRSLQAEAIEWYRSWWRATH